jgi:hypothetical protein
MISELSAIAQVITAVALAYNIWQTWRVKKNVVTIEKATNSMKDALVAASSKAGIAEGTAAGLVEGHAAGLEQGRAEERK